MAQSVGKIATKSSEPGLIEQIDIFSNTTGKSVSLTNGLVSFTYVESIMNDTINVNVTFLDSGNSIDNKNIVEGLPLVGQEKVVLKFSDNNKNTLGDKPELVLYVNKITPTDSKVQKAIISLELVSKESILNQKIRITKRLDGKTAFAQFIVFSNTILGQAPRHNLSRNTQAKQFKPQKQDHQGPKSKTSKDT